MWFWAAMIFFGLIIGLLSSLSGLGGGFLAVPFLLYMGKKVQLAVGTAFMFVALVAVSSLVAHSRLGNVDFKTGLWLGLGGVIGAQFGPLILKHISDQNFKVIFGALLIATGAWLIYQSRTVA